MNSSKRKTISFRTPRRVHYSRYLKKKNPYNAYLYFCEERRKSFNAKGKDEPTYIELSSMWDELTSEEKGKFIQNYNEFYQLKEEDTITIQSPSLTSQRESYSSGKIHSHFSLYSYNPEIHSIIRESLMKRGKSERKRIYQNKNKKCKTTIKKYKNKKEIKTPLKRLCLCGYCHLCRVFNYSKQINNTIQ